MRVEDFDFDLPAELIAQAPCLPARSGKAFTRFLLVDDAMKPLGPSRLSCGLGIYWFSIVAGLFRHACLACDIAAKLGTGRNHPYRTTGP